MKTTVATSNLGGLALLLGGHYIINAWEIALTGIGIYWLIVGLYYSTNMYLHLKLKRKDLWEKLNTGVSGCLSFFSIVAFVLIAYI